MKIKNKKTLKEWLIRKRNLRDLLFLQHRQQTQKEEKKRSEEAETLKKRQGRAAGEKSEPKEAVWSAKTQEIRNRMTSKKRSASERWNRFAGTGDSGGRGL